VIVVGKDLMQFNDRILLGAFCCVCGAVSYGLFTSLNQKFKYDKNVFLMIAYFGTFVLTGTITFVSSRELNIGGSEVFGLIWNGVFAIAIANLCWLLALDDASTAKISNLAYMTPFISLIWTFLFLHEPISITAVIGLVIIIGGIFIQLKEK
jgi:drug/metabolite transporter (DMT)-like permease